MVLQRGHSKQLAFHADFWHYTLQSDTCVESQLLRGLQRGHSKQLAFHADFWHHTLQSDTCVESQVLMRLQRGHFGRSALHARVQLLLPKGTLGWALDSHIYIINALHVLDMLALHAKGSVKCTLNQWHDHAGVLFAVSAVSASYSCVGTLTLAWAFLDYSVGIFWCKLLLVLDKL